MADVELKVLVEEELLQRAQAAAAKRGETLSDVVRSALENYVKYNTQPGYDAETALKHDPLLSLRFSSGVSDVGRRAKEILWEAVDRTEGFRLDNDHT